MEKTILIFGAGINQMELIREAKKMGVTTVVVDPAEDPPGRAESDFYYQIDGQDYETTKLIAIKHSADGIVTGQMEKPLRLMARLGKDLSCIFNSPEVIEKSLNKILMKRAFVEHGVPCAKGIVFGKGEKISKKILSELSYPMVIKPADAFSSRGVLKVSSFDELLHYEKEARSYSQEDSVLVEEFLEGREFSVESITYKNATTIIQVTEKFITPYPNTVEMAHLQPARISEMERLDIEYLVKKSIKSIGINNSASHAEVMQTKKGLFMIEIGARLGGDFISSYLTKSSTGVSMDKAAIQVALGQKPDLQRKFERFSMIEYLKLEENKTVVELPPLDEIRSQEGFVFAHYFIKQGDRVKKITNSAHRPICLLFENSNLENLFKSMKEVKKSILSKIVLQ